MKFKDASMFYRMFVKQILDVVVALLLLIILSPVFMLVSIILFASYGTSPFFVQERVGYKGKKFEVIKFKTMNDQRDEHGNLLSDERRLTGIGKWLRKTSLDEIPQLVNIIKRDMSFVGPRPLLIEYIPLYTAEQFRRHEVIPGISGWAQINGRNTIRWDEKFIYDVWYVNHISFWLDTKILFITVMKVLKSEGISGRGVATAEKFNGNN